MMTICTDTRVTTTCRELLLDLASNLLLSLTLRLGTVYHRSWDVLLWTLPLDIIWRRSCSLELMTFLLTFSSGVLRRRLQGAVRPSGRRLGLTTLHCISARLLVSRFFYRFIVKCLRPLFVGGTIQIAFDWLIDWLTMTIMIQYCTIQRIQNFVTCTVSVSWQNWRHGRWRYLYICPVDWQVAEYPVGAGWTPTTAWRCFGGSCVQPWCRWY